MCTITSYLFVFLLFFLKIYVNQDVKRRPAIPIPLTTDEDEEQVYINVSDNIYSNQMDINARR